MVQASMRHCGRSARSIGSERGAAPDSPRRLVAVIKPMSAAFRGIQVVPRYFIALKPFWFQGVLFLCFKGGEPVERRKGLFASWNVHGSVPDLIA